MPSSGACRTSGVSPEQGHTDDLRAGALMKTCWQSWDCSAREEKAPRKLFGTFQYLNELKKRGKRTFIWTDSSRIKGNVFKLNEGRLDIRKILYSEGGETQEQVSQKVFKARPDGVLCSLV